MIIRLATKNEAPEIAQIHYQEINQGFLRKLGKNFLSKLYEAIIISPSSFVVVAEESDKIIGFISGCLSVKNFCQEFLKKYFFRVFFILLPKIFNRSILKKIFETLKYSDRKKEKLPPAELLTIAVLRDFQGQGIAQKMFEKFVSEMEKRDIKQFKVVVGENLPRAIRFYGKIGFKFHSSIFIHKDKPSRIYIYSLKDI